jgi:hypothetical protein
MYPSQLHAEIADNFKSRSLQRRRIVRHLDPQPQGQRVAQFFRA